MRLAPLFIFWSLWFICFSTRTIFSPMLPLIEDHLSLSHGASGGLFTSFSIGHSLTLLLAGRYASAWGFKKMVAVGFVGIGLVMIGVQWAESYIGFQILFFLLGVAGGTYLPCIFPIMTTTYEDRHWGKVIGIHESAASFSIFSIPILVAFGLKSLSWKEILFVHGIASLVLPILFWKVSAEPGLGASHTGGRIGDLLKRRSTWIMIILWIFSVASSIGIYSILPLYLVKERGIDFHLANTFFGISRIGGFLASIVVGFLADRYGHERILRAVVLLTGLSTMGISLSPNIPLVWVSLIFQATFCTAFFPLGFSTISRLTSFSERSMAVGITTSIGVAFGMGLTPFLLGLTADYIDFRTGILWLGILMTLTSFMVRFLRKT